MVEMSKIIISDINKRYLQIIVLVCVIITTIAPISSVHGGSLAEGYPTSGNITRGSLVILSNDTPPQVELANLNNSEYLVGVVGDNGDSLITLNKEGEDVVVVTGGEVFAYVSDLSGDIKPGDFIGTSWINGVGMKAERVVDQKLLGVALEAFDAESTAVDIEDVETIHGTKSARVGKIAIRLFEREVGQETGQSLSALESFALRVAGKDVPFARVIAAFGLFTISVIIAGVFLANAIKSSLISIGRNPLAQGSIFNTLTQISGVSIGLVLIGAALSYVVLIL